MSNSRIMKWITGALEGILAIPLLGGIIVIGTHYWVLPIMLILHIITLGMTKKDNGASAGSILGIITSVIAWIPLLGWLMHLITAVFLLIGALTKDKPQIA